MYGTQQIEVQDGSWLHKQTVSDSDKVIFGDFPLMPCMICRPSALHKSNLSVVMHLTTTFAKGTT